MNGWVIAILILSVIFVLHWILFCFPRLLHDSRSSLANYVLSQKGIFLFAHRAGGSEEFENSFSAFRGCVRAGVDAVEFDIRRTGDGKLIIAHDESLGRITGQSSLISELSYQNIEPYLDKIPSDFDVLPFEKINFDREKPPLLEEVLPIFAGTRTILNIDIKSSKWADAAEAISLLKANGLLSQSVLNSMKGLEHRRVKSAGDGISMFFNAKPAAFVFLAFLFGLLPFWPFPYDFFEIPYAFNSLWRRVKDTKFRFVWYAIRALSCLIRLLVWHLKRRGIPTILFVANEDEDFRQAVSLGGKGIMTDRPSDLRKFLQRNDLSISAPGFVA